MAPFRDPCGFAVRSWPNDRPACPVGTWSTAARIAALGMDGTKGVSRLSLIGAISLYRMMPNRDLWHPATGSSHAGLAAARAGLGVAGVISALASCGCMQPGVWKQDSNPCT